MSLRDELDAAPPHDQGAEGDIPEAEVVSPESEMEVQPGVALVRHEHGVAPSNLFRTDDPVEVVAKATEVANALKGVLDRQGLTETISGKKHVKVEGWQTVGTMLGIVPVCVSTKQLDEKTWEATVEARTLDGRVVGRADAMCSGRESRGPWSGATDQARRSMAQTRATSKALKSVLGFVVTLAGYESTPAEEMGHAADDTPRWGPSSDSATNQQAGNAIVYLGTLMAEGLNEPLDPQAFALEVINHFGYLPKAAIDAVLILARLVRALTEPPKE